MTLCSEKYRPRCLRNNFIQVLQDNADVMGNEASPFRPGTKSPVIESTSMSCQ
jgi:hypothetical protein